MRIDRETIANRELPVLPVKRVCPKCGATEFKNRHIVKYDPVQKLINMRCWDCFAVTPYKPRDAG